LLPALALKHANGSAILRIEHFQKKLGPFAALASWDRIRFEAGKDFIFKFVIHQFTRR
jgi:hypothetical protein